MRDLRLIGVHDDGEHLVVTDDSTGEEFRLRIDEPLRAAARRDRPRLGQLQIALGENVRPREVQAMIRAGATADEVAARTGWDPDKIARFEGPVLAEREHVASRARTVRMRGGVQGDSDETLADRARARLGSRDVDITSVEWDARRDEEGQWTVSATFTAGGRERVATWWFDPAGMSVVAKNDEAKWLSEAEAPAGPVPSAVRRPTAVFDVEVEESRAERAHRADPDELIASMREHSGARSRRLGARKRSRTATPAPADDDALPFDTDEEHPPAARGPHPKDRDGSTESGPSAATTGSEDTDGRDSRRTSGGSEDTGSAEQADAAGSSESTTPSESGVASGQGEPTRPTDGSGQSRQEDSAEEDGTDGPAPSGPAERSGKKSGSQGKSARGRKGRASVPSWDDVMFGTTRD